MNAHIHVCMHKYLLRTSLENTSNCLVNEYASTNNNYLIDIQFTIIIMIMITRIIQSDHCESIRTGNPNDTTVFAPRVGRGTCQTYFRVPGHPPERPAARPAPLASTLVHGHWQYEGATHPPYPVHKLPPDWPRPIFGPALL